MFNITAFTEMQINTAVICLYTTIKTAKIKSKIIYNKGRSWIPHTFAVGFIII